MTDKRPFDALNNALNKTVKVRLKEGVELSGTLTSYDVHMNVVLENAEQTQPAKVTVGTVLLRGDAVIYISTS